MTDHYLYYAGMADDRENEQIGLAISRAGGPFERVGKSGLVLERDPAVEWRSLRVCNPTVLRDGDRFLMVFQGIARETQHVSIGIARSPDGISWRVEDPPALPWTRMAEVDPRQDSTRRVALVEPGVLREGSTYRMWFVYMHSTSPGNALFYAESEDLRGWRIRDAPLLSGTFFGRFRLHYPQVVPVAGGYELYFMLRNLDNGVDGIFRMRSPDGIALDGLEQLLPSAANGLRLEPRSALRIEVAAARLDRAVSRLGAALNSRWYRWTRGGRNLLGFGHPHVIPEGDSALMYFHGSHAGPRGLWADVGRCRLEGRRCRDVTTVFRPAAARAAWDSFFVADPFVLVVD